MIKTYTGAVDGRSITRFLGGLTVDQQSGTHVSLELFEGRLNDQDGSFGFTHSQTLIDGVVVGMSLTIAPESGTGDLAGISGGGGIRVEPGGTHRIWFDYNLPC